MARRFVLARLTTLRGVDLDRFDFDYDVTWMGFFLDEQGRELGRYGGRGPESAEGRSSLAGLRYALEQALARHKAGQARALAPRKGPARTIDDYPASKRLSPKACAHCHHAYDYRHEARRASGKWTMEELWVYPLPENVGLEMENDQGDRARRVRAGSSAARAGLKAGDRLVSVNGQAIASFAELQYALHRAPARGALALRYERGGKPFDAQLTLPADWRKTDVSWRRSLRGVGPSPGLRGVDLSAKEKRALGLGANRLALEQGPFVREEARQAGLRQGDVVIGIGGQALSLSGRQLLAHVRLNYKAGDAVTYDVLRDGKRLAVKVTLRER